MEPSANVQTSIRDLPNEVLCQVLFHVQPNNIGTCLRVCKQFKTVIEEVTLEGTSKQNRAKMYAEHLEQQLKRIIHTLRDVSKDPLAAEMVRSTPELTLSDLQVLLERAALAHASETISAIFLNPMVDPNSTYTLSALTSDRKETPLHHIAMEPGPKQLAAARAMLSHPDIDPTAKCYFGWTPLMTTMVFKESFATFLEIAKHPRTDLYAKCGIGKTAMDLAVEMGHIPVFRYYLQIMIGQGEQADLSRFMRDWRLLLSDTAL